MVNKINQNYNNAIYKSDEFLRGVTRGNPLSPILPHSPPPFTLHREKIGLCPPGNQPLLRPCVALNYYRNEVLWSVFDGIDRYVAIPELQCVSHTVKAFKRLKSGSLYFLYDEVNLKKKIFKSESSIGV